MLMQCLLPRYESPMALVWSQSRTIRHLPGVQLGWIAPMVRRRRLANAALHCATAVAWARDIA
jgi:hypothetical protein